MAWFKNVFFPVATDNEWASSNPNIPANSIIFVTGDGGVRMKLGTGDSYDNTQFIDEVQLNAKLPHPNGNPSDVIFADGSTGQIDALTVDKLKEDYHLVTLEEWQELRKESIPKPSLVVTPNFSLVTKIGAAVSGGYSFSFSKGNNGYIKTTTGGQIIASEGNWSGTGGFDLRNVSSRVITGSNTGFSIPTTIKFTIKCIDIYDVVHDEQVIELEIKNLCFAGVHSSKNITNQSTLTGLKEVVTNDFNGVEFSLDAQGAQQYYHVLVPADSASGLDIRLQANPAPGSANMQLFETINLNIGSITKTFNHYVSDYTSSGVNHIILRK